MCIRDRYRSIIEAIVKKQYPINDGYAANHCVRKSLLQLIIKKIATCNRPINTLEKSTAITNGFSFPNVINPLCLSNLISRSVKSNFLFTIELALAAQMVHQIQISS